MTKKPVIDTRSLSARFETHMKRSGEVSSGLRHLSEGKVLYEATQHSERELRAAKAALDFETGSLVKQRSNLELMRRQLVSLARICVETCELFGLEVARSVLISDVNDEPAIAAQVASYVKQVQHAGPGMARALMLCRSQWLQAEAAHSTARKEHERSGRDFGRAFYRANSVVAQGQALLAASGLPVPGRTLVRRKKATGKASSSAPVPASTATAKKEVLSSPPAVAA